MIIYNEYYNQVTKEIDYEILREDHTLSEFKALAKKTAKLFGIKPTHAHELIARALGFKTYNAYLASKREQSTARWPDPEIRQDRES